jgi:RNA polymerase sigma factor (TIGR02999 family)
MKTTKDITALLIELNKGTKTAASELFPLVYNELRRRAHAYMRGERQGHTLQTTALVNEAYIRLVKQKSLDWKSRAHFFNIAAKTMRHILVDYARKRNAEKGPGGYEIVPLDDALDHGLILSTGRFAEVLKMDESLERLSKLDPLLGKIVELRWFAGRTVEETADILGISGVSVKRKWKLATAWLKGDLRRGHEHFARGLEIR